MTVSATTTRVSYTGDGSSTAFTITFNFYLSTDVQVLLGSSVQSTGYTITGGNGSTGTCTFSTAPANGATITLILNVPLTQLTAFVDGTAFPSASVNQINDRSIQAALRLQDQISRSLRAPDGDVSPSLLLPPATTRANRYPIFDSSGNISTAAALPSGTLSQATIGQFLYPQTPAELAASVTPINYAYPEPDLRRRGITDFTGATDYTSQINDAIKVARTAGSAGYIWHPGGTISHSQILFAGGYSVLGGDPLSCIFDYKGAAASSAWRVTNNGTSSPTPNTSGFGRWLIDGVTIRTAIGSSTAAGIEINACGYAFYDIGPRTVISGTFKYGVILDGAEVTHIHPGARIDVGGPSGSADIWIVNGPDRTATQGQGYTNSITMSGLQLNVNGAASFNIMDDGGGNHDITDNNCNGAHTPIRVAGVVGLTIKNNEIENALAGAATGLANVLFTDTAAVSGTNVGACLAFEVSGGNTFGADMAAGAGHSLAFSGSTMHQGGEIFGNWFRNNVGRLGDIDVTKLSGSFAGYNHSAAAGANHYTGLHNDADGNTLFPPQNGTSVGYNTNAYVHGDTRYRHWFLAGIQLTRITVPYSASMTFDSRLANIFQITANNGTAFTINNPTTDPVNGSDGTIITVQIRNTSGGALGAITWGGNIKLAGAWVSPATGNNRSITFWRDETNSAWYERSRSPADVPN